MRSPIPIVACVILGALTLVQSTSACFQTAPHVSVRSRLLAGTVTLNGEPLIGAVLTLHKFLGSYSIELDHADAPSLGTSVVEEDGSFTFGEVPTGKYVIVMVSPSHESTEVEVSHPKVHRERYSFHQLLC